MPAALAAAERTLPILQAVQAEDRTPLARPPVLAAVPDAARERGRRNNVGITFSLVSLAAGTAATLAGRRRGRP